MPDAHREIQKLLPWYVTGTLAAGEREALRRHLGECLPCRSAYAEALRMQKVLAEQATIPLGQDRGFSRLLRRIDRKERGRYARRLPLSGNRLAVASCVLAAVAIFGLWRGLSDRPADGDYSTLFGDTDGTANRIDVIFSGEIGPAQLEQFLRQFDGVILSGPTDIGRYTIEVDLAARGSVADVLAALELDDRVRFAGRSFAADAADATGGVELR